MKTQPLVCVFSGLFAVKFGRKGGVIMNQIEIGKFVANCRKEKKLTQAQLAEKLSSFFRCSYGTYFHCVCMDDIR